MESLHDWIALGLSLVAKLGGEALRDRLSRISFWLVPDVPRLAGAWVVRFRDPLPRGGSRIRRIDVVLTQFGRRVRGSGHIQGEPGDPFEYRGWIRRNAFFGAFRRRNSGILAGSGSFVLKIAADGNETAGSCGWYDSALDDVRSSRYEWTRVDKRNF